MVVLEFGSPCLPRSPSLIHDSRHDQQWIFFILLRSTSSLTLNVSLSRAERTRELSFASAVLKVATGRPVLSEELSSSKELTLISWERDVFLPSCIISGRPDLSRIGFRVGWFDWKILLVEQVPLLVVEQFSDPILFSIRASMRSVAEVEVTCILCRIRLLQFSV